MSLSRGVAGLMHRSAKKGPVKPLIERYRFIKNSRVEEYGGSYLKEAWATIPEAVIACVFGIIGISYGTYKFYRMIKYGEGRDRPYKQYYLVLRPDDPRVKQIKTEYYSRKGDVYDLST